MEKLSRAKILGKILKRKNKPYTVWFYKKDGTLRKMHAIQGVKPQHGGTNKVEKDDNSYLTTFDVDKANYRTINLDTVVKIKLGKHKYEII